MSENINRKGEWKRFFHVCKEAGIPKTLFVLYIVMNLVSSFVTIKVPEVSGNFFAGDASVKSVSMFIGVELLVTVLSQTALYINHLCRYQMNRNLRNTLWGKILKLKPAYYEETSSNALISRITVDADSMNEFLMDVVLGLGFEIYVLVLSIAEMNAISTKAGFMLLAFLPFTIVFAYFMGKYSHGFEKLVKQKMADLTDFLSKIIACLPVIKANNKELYESERGEKLIEEYYQANRKVIGLQIAGDVIGQIISAGPQIVILLLGVRMLTANEIDAAGWYVFYVYAGTFLSFASTLGSFYQNSKGIQGRLSKIADVLDEKDEVLMGYADEISSSGDIVFDHVSFAYGEDEVLKDVSFVIPHRGKTAIIGGSGCGKTTIAKLIERIYEPDDGRIMTEGHVIRECDVREWRKKIAFVIQNTPLLSGTIRENVLYGVKREVSDEEIYTAMKQAHVHDFVSSLAEGLEYQVGQFGEHLSGGQKQKLSIVRAILSDAEILILDEPTASLDITSTREIIDTLDILKDKRTIIEITHHAGSLKHADHIIVVNEDHSVIEGDYGTMSFRSEFMKELIGSAG